MTEEQLKLFEDNKYIVHNIVKKYYDCDKEDLISQGYLLLLQATTRYNKELNVKPKTYFYSILNRELYDRLKQQRKNNIQCDKRNPLKFYNILTDNDNWEDFIELELYNSFEIDEKIDNKKLLEEIIQNSNLTKREKKIIDLFLEGFGLKQISSKLNIDEQYCRNRYCGLLKKLKKEGEKICTNLKK